MSNKLQTTKNIELTHKLMAYLVSGNTIPDLPSNASFVPFSAKDQKLNKANEELLTSLVTEEKPILKAVEPKTAKGTWIFTPVNF